MNGYEAGSGGRRRGGIGAQVRFSVDGVRVSCETWGGASASVCEVGGGEAVMGAPSFRKEERKGIFLKNRCLSLSVDDTRNATKLLKLGRNREKVDRVLTLGKWWRWA